MAKYLSLFSMAVATVGVFFGFYYLSGSPDTALQVITLTTVGVVGLLAFVRHFFFHKSDAKRMGWETDHPDWMFEVGFANLAFSVMAFIAALAGWGPMPQAVVVLGYAAYLLQASLLHGYRFLTDPERSWARFWRSFFATLVFAGMMLFFSVYSFATL